MPTQEPRNLLHKRSRGHCGRCFTPFGCIADLRPEVPPCGCHEPVAAACWSPGGCSTPLFETNPAWSPARPVRLPHDLADMLADWREAA